MAKSLYIAEKPSVAREFGKALGENMKNSEGYMESEHMIVTWCVGHLVTMSYPESYDIKYKKWSLSTLPFLPKEFKYEIIPGAAKQFQIVSGLLNRPDVDTIYVCTDSGREGEYIYRLVEQMAGVKGKKRRRVWIDSQTEEEILRGIREAKDLAEYDNLSASAYLRAKEDYLMGINFSRLLTVKYGDAMASFLKQRYCVVSVGRVMTCVLGMVVRREREIRDFVKTPFYRVVAELKLQDASIEAEWRAAQGSKYFESPKLYKENGFRKKEDAEELVAYLKEFEKAKVSKIEKKKEKKNPPLFFNLAELQNNCAKLFKISPDETLRVVQELYEKKLVTYPRTDARVLSRAVAKEIHKNIRGLAGIPHLACFAEEILNSGAYKGIEKTRYVNDRAITDHYAIIPTGQGTGAVRSLPSISAKVYEVIVRRFLSVFYPAAVYQKVNLAFLMGTEQLFVGFKVLEEPGYLRVMNGSYSEKRREGAPGRKADADPSPDGQDKNGERTRDCADAELLKQVSLLKKSDLLEVEDLAIKEGETSPPKRYNSGSMILAMENAGQLIEDEELRAQIKRSGIGTSATRAEILKKLVNNKYLNLNKKTQIITPALLGEMIFDVVNASIRSLLNPELTASWEKGLTYVAQGSITPEEYMEKLEHFIRTRTSGVLSLQNKSSLRVMFQAAAAHYKATSKKK